MNENALIEVLKGGISTMGSSVSAVVGAIITTLFLRKNTETTEFEKIKAGRFESVIDKLLDSGRMSYLEYYKCKNFLMIAKKADEMYTEDQNSHHKEYDFDWFIRFYDYSSNISDQEMQDFWARLLAKEIENPKSVSLTLLHALFMMRQEQAHSFCNISQFAFMDASNKLAHLLLFISTNKKAYLGDGITHEKLKELERLGLVECSFSKEYHFNSKVKFRTGNRIVTVYGNPKNNKILAGNTIFTKDGQRLYSLLDREIKMYNADILDFAITSFKTRGCRVIINDKEVK